MESCGTILRRSRRSLGPAIQKNEQEQIDFREGLPDLLSGVLEGASRPVRLFCQDECRIGLMPITRHRITLPGVKPIQESKPGYEYFYLYGAVEPETGQRFFTEHERLNSNCFQVFLDRFAEAFPQSHNVIILDNGQLCESGVESKKEHRSGEPTEHMHDQALVGTHLGGVLNPCFLVDPAKKRLDRLPKTAYGF